MKLQNPSCTSAFGLEKEGGGALKYDKLHLSSMHHLWESNTVVTPSYISSSKHEGKYVASDSLIMNFMFLKSRIVMVPTLCAFYVTYWYWG